MEKIGTQAKPAYQVDSRQQIQGESICPPRRTEISKPRRQHERREAAAPTQTYPKQKIMKPRLKDPRGGLTAAGRQSFLRKQGAHLRPGVKKAASEMSPAEMKRKGSWAARFYGRKGSLPPLKDKHGEPTRFALTAAAWGEPVPKTQAQARKIAVKGRRLLARYHRARSRR